MSLYKNMQVSGDSRLGGYEHSFGNCGACGELVAYSKYWIPVEAGKHKNKKGIAPFFHPWADRALCGPRCVQNYREGENSDKN